MAIALQQRMLAVVGSTIWEVKSICSEPISVLMAIQNCRFLAHHSTNKLAVTEKAWHSSAILSLSAPMASPNDVQASVSSK